MVSISSKSVFADTSYWIAIASPKDQWHDVAKEAFSELGPTILVTTDSVLTEFLTFFSKSGQSTREKTVKMARMIMESPNNDVISQTRDLFLRGVELYEQRLDKGYSLTDCMSMVHMKKFQLVKVLSSDHNFEQENFRVLMKIH